jgi:uncharacterized membrane protein
VTVTISRNEAGPATFPEQVVTPTRRRRPPVVLLLLVLAQAVIALDVDLPVVRPLIALVTFVALPTLVLHRRARFAADTEVGRLSYAFGVTLLGLILGGLLLDTVLPVVGIDHPLAPAPLAVAWLVVDVALLMWRRTVPLFAPDAHRSVIPAACRRVLDARLELTQGLAVLGLLLAVVGAIRLNNGAGGGAALVAVVLAGAAMLTLLVGPGNRSMVVRDAWVIGPVAAGLLLATSLRGGAIAGHDIQAEFLAFRLTNEAQNWQMSALPSAYNACLSVNILPTVLVQTTGLSGELVFKVLLQLVFATVPVLTYLFSRRFVSRRLALAATTFTMAFPTFFTDMPYLVRQEIAFFFLALVLLAATEPGRTRVRSGVLVFALGLGVVVSHYSTTYLLLMALVAALLAMGLTGVLRRLRRLPGHRPAHAEPHDPLVLLHPGMVAALIGATLLWAGPITDTGGHATSVVKETIDSLTGKGVDGPSSSDTSYWIFAGDETTPRERMDMFVQETVDYRDAEIPAGQQVVPDPGSAELEPALHEQAANPVDNALRLGSALLMQVFALLGVAWLLRRRLRGTDVSRDVTFLTGGAMAALGLVVLVPNLSVDYGVLRAFQQTLLIMAPTMALGMSVALRPLTLRPLAARAPRLALALVAVIPVGLLLVLSGVLPAVTGSQQQRIAMADAGTYYDRFAVSDSSLEAMHWLASVDHADRSNERIIANRNVNVRLLAMSDNRAPVSDRLYPTLLSKDAYVFVDAQILEQGVSTIFYTGDLLTYTYPLQDLDEHLDLVYSAPDARIYR